MTVSLDSPEVQYLQGLFFELLDSIRYARDNFNPKYRHLETGVKLKTTYELRKISERAALYFYEQFSNSNSDLEGEEEIAELKRKSLEHALNSIERGE